MWYLRRFGRFGAAFHALELTAERAGHAWACPFASSAEYEASIIEARRDAGVYGPKRQRRQIIAGVLAGLLVVFCLVQFI
jgi:hypothetical protein